MSRKYFPVPLEGYFSIAHLQTISDWLYGKGFTLEEVHDLVPRLYAQLSNCTDEELQHHLLYALGEAYEHYRPLAVSVAPFKTVLQQIAPRFAHHILDIILLSKQREHYDIFDQALSSEKPVMVKAAQELIRRHPHHFSDCPPPAVPEGWPYDQGN